jgi:hypothetical protein
MQRNRTLIALQAVLLIDLQKERAVAERKTAVHTFSAADTNTLINHVFKIRTLDIAAGNCVDRTKLIFRSGISCKGLRIKKAGTEVAVAAHFEIMKTFDCRNGFDTSVRTLTAADTFVRINLPNGGTGGDFLFDGKETGETDQTGNGTASATIF